MSWNTSEPHNLIITTSSPRIILVRVAAALVHVVQVAAEMVQVVGGRTTPSWPARKVRRTRSRLNRSPSLRRRLAMNRSPSPRRRLASDLPRLDPLSLLQNVHDSADAAGMLLGFLGAGGTVTGKGGNKSASL